jgi:ABC-type Na+ efflux pump permease subunit
MNDPHKYASEEQLMYAKVLSIGVKVGFVLLVVTFGLYMGGVLKPLVPVHQLPKYWHLPVDQYVKATGTPTGWAWVKMIAKGDMLNLVGIVVLAGISIVSTLAVLPMFARRGEKALLIISVLLIIVLVVSASSILQ